jgi:hypothetical protein
MAKKFSAEELRNKNIAHASIELTSDSDDEENKQVDPPTSSTTEFFID